MDSSSNTNATDSGVETPIKRRRLEEKNTAQAIIDTMSDEIGNFGALIIKTKLMKKLEDEDYSRLYRLYLAALKALSFLETERDDLEYGLEPLPANIHRVLKSNNDNVMVWSQYFYKNPSPTKIKVVKTVPSPTTQRIGGLLHSVGSFAGLTAEAVCSSKRKKENFENMGYLLTVTKEAITILERFGDDILKKLEPYVTEKALLPASS